VIDLPPLFDEFIRTDSSPSKFLEGTYKFLNRASSQYWQQVRDAMATWLGHVPARHQTDLRQRLTSGSDSQFNAAYLELYVHETFWRLGREVIVHPDTGTARHPDFLVKDDVQDFYVEARHIVGHSDAQRARLSRRAALYDALQGVNSPNFFLWIDVREIGPQDLAKRSVVRALEDWVATLNPDEEDEALKAAGSLGVLKALVWRDRGWVVGFRAIPEVQEGRGKPGIRPLGIFGAIEVNASDGVAPLKRALLDKANAYGHLGKPFVIALGVDWFAGRDEFDITGALFGGSQLQITAGTDEPMLTRAPNGFWFGGDRWLRRHVTGVLQVTNLHPAFFAKANPTLWLHPEPEHAFDPPAAWSVMRPTDSGEFVHERAGISHQELFGIADPWPVGEAFPDEP
jgi:hypothetical protein